MSYMVISYDISDDRKRNKVANILEDYGKRVQYSVFECRLDEKTLAELIDKLKPFPERNDSIRVYQICEACLKRVILLGKGKIAEEPRFFVV
ncbi:CRISPR-associated endonuclease Cas2 [Dehalococcoidia bacterium]|nr:CRISPR-associated endonuclease Cas2 [Dehalococcoidia bacterium]